MNSRSIYLALLLSLCTSLTYGQKIDTVYYDADWKATSRNASSYYRVLKTIEPNKRYDAADYYNSGQLQMTGSYSSMSPEIKQGLFTWYYQNGNKKSQIAYKNNKESGSAKYWKEDGTAQTALEAAALEKQPSFPGGIAKLYEYIGKNFVYPQSLLRSRPTGTIILNFVIEKNGAITDVEVVQSVHPLMDAEAVRVLRYMPKWEPGIQNGKPVKVKYTIPLRMN